MAQKELTKEAFKKTFKDNFEMTNYVIALAKQQIHAGNEDLNVTELLSAIRRNPEKLREDIRKGDKLPANE